MISTTRRPREIFAVLTILAGAALLQACASEDSVAEPHEDATPQASTAPEDGPQELSGATCLPGSWKLQNETFEAASRDILEASGEVPAEMKAAMDISLSGDSFIRFDDKDNFTAWQDAFTMTMSVNGRDVRYVNESDDAGVYTASDEIVWVYDVIMLHTSSEMIVDGMGSVALDSDSPGAGSLDFFGYTAVGPAEDLDQVDGAAAYTCSADELVLESDGGLSVTFTRAATTP